MSKSFQLSTIIKTSEGQYQGSLQNGILSWKGIRYAKAPVGALRWKAPQNPEPFNEIKTAYEFGPICPQKPYDSNIIYSIPTQTLCEDCLFLNIWSSQQCTTNKKAVIVWIHGGRLMREGSSHPLYNGANLAQQDVVVVSINYRLNAFGFFAHPDLLKENQEGLVGNYGILDQIKALEWIQNNISKFHGDPNNVTLMGESAGAWSISAILASDKTDNLYKRAILQSGAYMWKGPHLTSSKNGYISAVKEGQLFSDQLKATHIDDLRAISYKEIINLVFSDKNPLSCEPIIDGQLLKDDIPSLLNKHKPCSILIGTNADEWSVFSELLPDATIENFVTNKVANFKNGKVLWNTIYLDKQRVKSSYDHYFSDVVFHNNSLKLAEEVHKKGEQVFMYYFNTPSVNKAYQKLGAYHGVEIPYVFNTLDHENNNKKLEEFDINYAQMVLKYWVNFAKYGNPNAKSLPEWIKWTPKDQNCLHFKTKAKSEKHPLSNRLKQLEEFLKKEPTQQLTGQVLKKL